MNKARQIHSGLRERKSRLLLADERSAVRDSVSATIGSNAMLCGIANGLY
jgi:hypothetical protein